MLFMYKYLYTERYRKTESKKDLVLKTQSVKDSVLKTESVKDSVFLYLSDIIKLNFFKLKFYT